MVIMPRGTIVLAVGTVLISSWNWVFNVEASGVCGETKGCFGFPEDCNVDTPSQGCTAFFSWCLEDNDMLLLNIQAFTETYIAIGFSRSGKMPDTEVYACTSQLKVIRSRNERYTNIPLPLMGVSNQSVSLNNTLLECSFKRVLSSPNDTNFYNLSRGNTYTPLLAWGGELSAQGNLEMHSRSTFGPQEIDFTVIKGSSSPGLPFTELSSTVTDSSTRRRCEFVFLWMVLLISNLVI